MSTAAMNIFLSHTRGSETAQFVAHRYAMGYRAWRQQVEAFKIGAGVRAQLQHVAEAIWERHYAANDDAFDAVVDELRPMD